MTDLRDDELEKLRRTPGWTVPCLAEGTGGCKTVRTLDRRPILSDLVCDRHKELGHAVTKTWPDDDAVPEALK